MKKRVDLAREVDKLELAVTKKQKQNQWYENAAKELEVDLDDWMYPLAVFTKPFISLLFYSIGIFLCTQIQSIYTVLGNLMVVSE